MAMAMTQTKLKFLIINKFLMENGLSFDITKSNVLYCCMEEACIEAMKLCGFS